MISILKIIGKIIKYITLLMGTCVLGSWLILIAIKLSMSPWRFTYAVQTTGVFLKEMLHRDPEHIQHTNLMAKFYTHTKFIMHINSLEQDAPNKNSMLNFTIEFPSYIIVHNLFSEIFVRNIYYFKAKNDTPFIIDAGSNIGISILYFKTLYPHAQILGFEPGETSFDMLEKNIKNNNIHDVRVIKKALSDTKGTMNFYGDTTVATLIPDKDALVHKTVQTDKLSSYVDRPVDLLKMDIEGSETAVMQDLVKNDKIKFIDTIIMEYHYTPGKNRLSDMLGLLEKSGFSYTIKNNPSSPVLPDKKQQFFMIYAYRS